MLAWMLCLLSVGQVPSRPQPVAMVLAVDGTPELTRAGGKAATARVMDLLYEGDRLAMQEAKRLQITYLRDAHRELVKPGKTIVIGKRTSEPADAVEVQPGPDKSKKLVADILGDLSQSQRGAVVEFRSDPQAASVQISPIHETVIITTRPGFAWPAEQDAKMYVIDLYRTGSETRVFRWESANNRLKYPEDLKDLDRGLKYRWTVSAQTDASSRLLYSGTFMVAGSEEFQQLQLIEPLATSPDAADWLVAALGYESYGASAEALALYDKLVKESPDTSALHAARVPLLEQSGRLAEARQARRKAEELGYEFPKR